MKRDFKDVQLAGKPLEMKKHVDIDSDRINQMIEIKLKVFNSELTPDEARKLVNATFESVSAEEFAYGEQHLYEAGITDEIMAEGMDDIIDVFRDVLVVQDLNLPKGHPIQTYADEATALEKLLIKMEMKLRGKFILNEWLELYAQLGKINTHFSRKQHQLFPALERKGFDRPSKIMWTFDDRVRDAIKAAYDLLKSNQDHAFLDAQPNVIHLVRDILQKERDVLYPTSLKLLSEDDFALMRLSDDEIGYCLIDTPPNFTANSTQENKIDTEQEGKYSDSLVNDLKNVLEKHGLSGLDSKDKVLDVAIGKLTLDQINLIYKHMQVDLSYVDENDVVKFYTDTKHRVFPRSAGVIGRLVENCHPRESVDSVRAIIDAFRSGEQDKAEFWLDRGDKFIYIVYDAIRDDEGNFRGVLEMMQDVTHIRSLKGSQRLLSWKNSPKSEQEKPNEKQESKESFELTPKTIVGTLIKSYPFIKEYLVSLSPEYEKLNNPLIYGTMKKVATLDMLSQVGGLKVNDLIDKISQEIERKN